MFRAPGSEFWFKKKSIAEASVRNLERGTRTGTMNPNRNENPEPGTRNLEQSGPRSLIPTLIFAVFTLLSSAMLPATRMDTVHDLALQTVLDRLTGGVADRPDRPDAWVTAVRRMPARAAEFAAFPDGVADALRDVLHQRGIERLYTHQAIAIEHALAGRHVVL